MEPTPKTRARRKAFRREEILEAAFAEFVDKGYVATRVEDIAARAGVTKGTVYVYFADKEALFEATVRSETEPRFAALREAIASNRGTCAERLRTFLLDFYRIIAVDERSREILRLLLADGRRFPGMASQHYDEFFRPFSVEMASIIREGVAAGEFRASRLVDIPEIVFGPALLFTIWHLAFGGTAMPDVEDYIEAHIDVLFHGLCGPAAR
jgi:AcrR family transcriptional regulator